MRINKYIAQSTGLSRRAVDVAVKEGRVLVNSQAALMGQNVNLGDTVMLDGNIVSPKTEPTTIIFNKPTGFVCSRNSQGNRTIYELLPDIYKHLKSVGRLDKDSSGLLLMTDDGQLAYELTHPKFSKKKEYDVTLDKPLTESDSAKINGRGIMLADGISKLSLKQLSDRKHWRVTMSEGRNRQIRRTFSELGYTVRELHRVKFGPYELPSYLPQGSLELVSQ